MSKTTSKTCGRKAQGEETRATLIAVGARLFAQHGYAGVSMRTLAAEAEVNLATVGYHFGGKPGLYAAILQEIIDERDAIFPTRDEVEARLTEAGDDQAARTGVVDWFVGQLVREILDSEEYFWPTVMVSRELAHPSEHFPRLQTEFFDPSFEALCSLVQGVSPEETAREEVIIVSNSIISIVIKLLEGQKLITQRLGWESYEGHIDTVERILKKRVRGLLGLPMENM